MSPDVEESAVKYPPSVLEEPGQNLRFMHRRRVSRTDRNGDPLDGVVNLFDVAIVLAIGFLLAALAGFGLTDVLSGKNMTIVTNPGTSSMEVVVKQGNQIKKLVLQPGQQASGIGILIGQFWQLSDGSTIYVPASGTTCPRRSPRRARPHRLPRRPLRRPTRRRPRLLLPGCRQRRPRTMW